ncbi:MAG TPA: M61 family peptidase [Gammaproteobacteria bacterium]|nr:M61 family peptidase [Gammaproteobacteria bacterium]
MFLSRKAALASLAVMAASPALAGYAKAPIDLSVKVTSPQQHVFYVTEKIPVTPGELTLFYPKYIPGEHGPTGPIDNLAGLRINADGHTVAWHRDPVDMYTFRLVVPKGANTLEIHFEFLSPVGGGAFTAGVSMTPRIVDLEWNQVALYPAGLPTKDILFRPRITLPKDWQYGTALVTKSNDGDTHVFNPVSFNNLVDSPLIAGEYFRQVNLAPGDSVHRYLDMVADYPQALHIGSQYTQDYRNLIVQATRLFASHHYKNYHFLLTLSDHTAHFGLEHHQSSDNRINADLFLNKQTMLGEASLLPHEYTHSWNGKFRRPAKLWQPNFQDPEHTRMLWVYEGLTNYWGEVLTARSGLWSPAQYRAMTAFYAAEMDHHPGREWRPLIDTTVAAQLLYDSPGFYRNWRRGTDFYNEGALIWLGVDTKIRELTHDKHSLDDFAKKFFGMDNGSYVTRTYTFADIVKGLNAVAPYDWADYLRKRLDRTNDHAPLGGLERGGWKLVYTTRPNVYERARETIHHYIDAMYSIGLSVSDKGRVQDVLWKGPAFRAGMAPGMTIISVNGASFTQAVLERAIANSTEPGHDKLTIVASGSGVTATYVIDYAGGIRYPHLERISDKPDYLDQIVSPVKG